MTPRRVAAGLLVGATALVTGAPTALADPAGPTDYRSEVVEVTPDVDGVEVSIVGGDAFVLLDVEPGVEVVVLGYGGEPYLRIDPDGTVSTNTSSPATYYNEERYGGDVPATASADAPPTWEPRGDDGSYAWHDHRAHRMERFAPLNAERGDPVLDGVVPLVVDGVDVDVRVVSTWMPAPSPLPWVAGLAAGVALVGAMVLLGALSRRSGAIVAGVALAASVIGLAGFASLPPETGRSITWWAAPSLALVAGVVAAAVRDRAVRAATVALSGVALVIWAWPRRDGWGRAILPTDAPYWSDRLVSATALVVGVGATVLGLVALAGAAGVPLPAGARRLSGPRAPTATPRPRHP